MSVTCRCKVCGADCTQDQIVPGRWTHMDETIIVNTSGRVFIDEYAYDHEAQPDIVEVEVKGGSTHLPRRLT